MRCMRRVRCESSFFKKRKLKLVVANGSVHGTVFLLANVSETITLVHGILAYHLSTLRPGTTVTRAEDIPIPENHTPWEID